MVNNEYNKVLQLINHQINTIRQILNVINYVISIIIIQIVLKYTWHPLITIFYQI